MRLAPDIKGFYESRTGSIQYVCACPATRRCAIIDPVLDFDEKSGDIATHSADEILAYVAERGYDVQWILDTHPHADHLSAADYLKQRTGAPTAIGARVVAVQKLWAEIYNLPALAGDGSDWDKLFEDGEQFSVGEIAGSILLSPGHTLASITYVIGDAAFVHDTLFMPDSGTARVDFPGGDAPTQWRSIQKIVSLPPATRVFTGHDYRPGGRAAAWESTVAIQKASNIHLRPDIDEAGYVTLREARDKTLPMPRLILHALQINLRAGRLPRPEANGCRYLKIPLNALGRHPWGD